jgi:hypothetical protein
VIALERRRQVKLERLADGGHPEADAKLLVQQFDHPPNRLDRLGRRGGRHDEAGEVDFGVLHPAGVNLDDSARLGDDQFDLAIADGSEVPALAVEGEPCGRMTGALDVGEERLADVTEGNLLVVGEGRDRRVRALAAASPAADQERQRAQVGVEFHEPRVPVGCLLLTVVLAVVLAGCADPIPPLPTDAAPEGGPSEAVAGNVVLRGDEATGCVWLELEGGGRMWPVWPAGFTARWDPGLTVLRPGGVAVAADGDRLDVGGGGVPAEGVAYPESCIGEDPDPLIWVVTSVSPAQ